ncbi:MAG: choice-of-anchor Q domain-containing protein, partial [Alphaproteobacteria bacterium]|nr:choice-of-anchor Q domain-containing protein [Alphaproteobacteria bacterium]
SIKDIGNILTRRAEFVDPSSYDFRLVAGSKAIDAGVAVPRVHGEKLVPEFEYRHPLKAVPREQNGTVDVGAYEFSSGQRTSNR